MVWAAWCSPRTGSPARRRPRWAVSGRWRCWTIATIGSADCFSISAFEDCGELYYAVNVNGAWRQLLWDHHMHPAQSIGILDSFPVSGPT